MRFLCFYCNWERIEYSEDTIGYGIDPYIINKVAKLRELFLISKFPLKNLCFLEIIKPSPPYYRQTVESWFFIHGF